MPIARGITGAGYETYDIALWIEGQPSAGETVLRVVASRLLTFPSTPAGLAGSADTAAAAQADFAVAVNGAAIGSIRFTAGNPVPALLLGAAAQLQPGDVLTLTGPTPSDAALADIALTLSLIR